MKNKFFTGDDTLGFEPYCGMVSVADGSVSAIGHLFASSICNGGPGPGFLAPWIYTFITGGIKETLLSLPKELATGSLHSSLYNEVS